tara:strand:+ start:5907 stop:6104 length:198 start_codon:yes stop_codon:yes gene_type:complete
MASVFSLYLINNHLKMKKPFFKILAKLNKVLLPSFTKKRLDIAKASKIQLVIIGWRAYVTLNSLD